MIDWPEWGPWLSPLDLRLLIVDAGRDIIAIRVLRESATVNIYPDWQCIAT